MNIHYNNNILNIIIDEKLDSYNLKKIEKKVINIIEDYAIESITLHIISGNKSKELDNFIEYLKSNYYLNIKVK